MELGAGVVLLPSLIFMVVRWVVAMRLVTGRNQFTSVSWVMLGLSLG